MNKKRRPVDEQIREHMKLWDMRKALVNGTLGEADRRASEDPALGIEYLYAFYKDERRHYRRYFRARFGYRLKQVGPIFTE